MNILIVTNHFWPENFRINDLSKELQHRGHQITVLTGIPNYPAGRFFSGYGIFKRRIDNYFGIKIIHVPLIPRGKGKSWNLILNYFSFAIMSCLLAPFLCKDRYDLIFVFETSPVTIGLPAIMVKKKQSIPIIFWVLDLWPESLSATRAVQSAWVLNLARRLVRFIYQRCDLILVSSRGYAASIQATGGYMGDIEYLPNWVEPEYLDTVENLPPIPLSNLPRGFRIMFAGNIGAAQDFETILEAAEQLRDWSDIHWLILGDGRRAEWVRDQVKQRKLETNFHLLGRFPPETMPAFFSHADVMLVVLRRERIFALTIPGKLQSYMACGKPIVAALDGEGARILLEANAGLVCSTESPSELASKILDMYRLSPDDRKLMGDRGKQYCLNHFNRDTLLDRLEDEMRGVIARMPN